MNAAEYFKAAIPAPFQILGLRLKPFSLGHYRILSRFDNAFVSTEEKDATMADLIMGVLVCSMTYEEFFQSIDEDGFQDQISAWGALCGEFDFKEKATLFLKYISDGQKQPTVQFEGDIIQSGAHWAETVFTTLTGNLGYSRTETLNMPLSEVLHDFYKFAESQGAVTILDDGMVQAIQEMEASSGN